MIAARSSALIVSNESDGIHQMFAARHGRFVSQNLERGNWNVVRFVESKIADCKYRNHAKRNQPKQEGNVLPKQYQDFLHSIFSFLFVPIAEGDLFCGGIASQEQAR
jgi:hypothetical protein